MQTLILSKSPASKRPSGAITNHPLLKLNKVATSFGGPVCSKPGFPPSPLFSIKLPPCQNTSRTYRSDFSFKTLKEPSTMDLPQIDTITNCRLLSLSSGHRVKIQHRQRSGLDWERKAQFPLHVLASRKVGSSRPVATKRPLFERATPLGAIRIENSYACHFLTLKSPLSHSHLAVDQAAHRPCHSLAVNRHIAMRVKRL